MHVNVILRKDVAPGGGDGGKGGGGQEEGGNGAGAEAQEGGGGIFCRPCQGQGEVDWAVKNTKFYLFAVFIFMFVTILD